MKGRSLLFLCFLALTLASNACVSHEQPSLPGATSARPQFVSTVASVIDGDTLTVSFDHVREKVRLVNIDCPESDQPFGRQATQLVTQLALGQSVTVTEFGRDKYWRLLGQVALPDGRILNHELVREGFCWWYRKYAPGDTVLEGLEAEARYLRLGLWADQLPVPPWEWRKRN